MDNKTLDSKFSSGLLDFHTHTNHSDGGDSPTQLVERAKEHRVSALALTDHHIISGIEEFNYACKQAEIFAIPFGTEISIELPQEVLEEGDNEVLDMVILGRNRRKAEKNFFEYESLIQKDRRERFIPQAIDRLRQMGFYVSGLPLDKAKTARELGELVEVIKRTLTEGANFDRLVRYVQSVNGSITREDVEGKPLEFVNKYIFALVISKLGYVRGFSLENAIKLADAMDCKLFIAHPGGEYGFLSDKILNYFIRMGVHGIEIRNYFNNSEQNAKFDMLAEKYKLIKSGGSDCHGNRGLFKIGMYDRPHNQLPKDMLEQLLFSLPT